MFEQPLTQIFIRPRFGLISQIVQMARGAAKGKRPASPKDDGPPKKKTVAKQSSPESETSQLFKDKASTPRFPKGVLMTSETGMSVPNLPEIPPHLRDQETIKKWVQLIPTLKVQVRHAATLPSEDRLQHWSTLPVKRDYRFQYVRSIYENQVDPSGRVDSDVHKWRVFIGEEGAEAMEVFVTHLNRKVQPAKKQPNKMHILMVEHFTKKAAEKTGLFVGRCRKLYALGYCRKR